MYGNKTLERFIKIFASAPVASCSVIFLWRNRINNCWRSLHQRPLMLSWINRLKIKIDLKNCWFGLTKTLSRPFLWMTCWRNQVCHCLNWTGSSSYIPNSRPFNSSKNFENSSRKRRWPISRSSIKPTLCLTHSKNEDFWVSMNGVWSKA